jgi:transcriptional regulator with XRE-family HTH domain
MPGTVIKHYRERRNYSQRFVAQQMGISQNAYSKIENNLTQLTVHHVKQLSKILQIPITDLLKDEYEIHKPAFAANKPITREDIIKMLDLIKEKVEHKHVNKHDSYLVTMSLLSSIDSLISHVH